MKAEDLLVRDFDLVNIAWSADRIHDAIKDTDSEWIVVEDEDEDESKQTRFSALRRTQLMRRLSASTDVRAVLDDAYVIVDIDAIAEHLGTPQVVLDAATPVGVIPPRHVTRGATRGSGTQTGKGLPTLAFGSLGPLGPPLAAAHDAGGASSASPGKPLTRQLVVELPTRMGVGEQASLLVSLSPKLLESSAAGAFAKPIGTEIDVVVKTSDGLSVVGRSEGELTVSEPQLEVPIQFKVHADRVGTWQVRVHAFCNGVSVGSLPPFKIVVETPEARSQRVPDQKASVCVDAGPRQVPDLSLYIFEAGQELSFRLSSADGKHHLQSFGSVRLLGTPREYFASFFQDVEALKFETQTDMAIAEEKLATKGAELFSNVLPAELKALLWSLRDKIDTVQISSEEPWIPWEVCRLTGETSGSVEEGPFFAEAFKITRWLTGASLASSLRLSNVALVVPGDSNLPQAGAERDFLLSLAQTGRTVTEVPATYLEVKSAMRKGGYDAWHFTGHAHSSAKGDSNRAAIELQDHQELRADEIVGNVENLLACRPFIFLNACQSAQAGMSLTGPGGWARRFLNTRNPERAASGFVGSYWSVYDGTAHEFAKTFYTALLSGKTVGEAGREARLAIRKDGDPTWLAYTIYADPYATVAA